MLEQLAPDELNTAQFGQKIDYFTHNLKLQRLKVFDFVIN